MQQQQLEEEHKHGHGQARGIPLAQAQTKIRNKQQLYKAMIAAGWFLPAEKSAICTTAFLQEVRANRCYCYKLENVTFKVCSYPPSIEELRGIAAGIIEGNEGYETDAVKRSCLALGEHIKRYGADQRWLLGLCSSMDPKLHIFDPAYRPPPKDELAPELRDALVDNRDGLFDGLDPLSAKGLKARGNAGLFTTKEQRLVAKLAAQKKRKEAADLAMQKAEADLQALRDHPEDEPQVKISKADYELLQRLKDRESDGGRPHQHHEVQSDQPKYFPTGTSYARRKPKQGSLLDVDMNGTNIIGNEEDEIELDQDLDDDISLGEPHSITEAEARDVFGYQPKRKSAIAATQLMKEQKQKQKGW
jgi:hypothetical protein